jgi:hypothetical protein
VKFKISGIRGGKSQENFLALPAVLRNRLLYLRYFGGALVPTIRHRWSARGIGPDYQKVDTFTNTGGMWRGLTSRIAGKRVMVSFTKSSLSSADATNLIRKIRRGKSQGQSAKQITKDLKDAKRLNKVQNRLKAKTSQKTTAFEILQPTRDEVRALTTWMEEHLERGLTQNMASVQNLNKRAIPDRFNQLLKRLPNPKNKR